MTGPDSRTGWAATCATCPHEKRFHHGPPNNPCHAGYFDYSVCKCEAFAPSPAAGSGSVHGAGPTPQAEGRGVEPRRYLPTELLTLSFDGTTRFVHARDYDALASALAELKVQFEDVQRQRDEAIRLVTDELKQAVTLYDQSRRMMVPDWDKYAYAADVLRNLQLRFGLLAGERGAK